MSRRENFDLPGTLEMESTFAVPGRAHHVIAKLSGRQVPELMCPRLYRGAGLAETARRAIGAKKGKLACQILRHKIRPRGDRREALNEALGWLSHTQVVFLTQEKRYRVDGSDHFLTHGQNDGVHGSKRALIPPGRSR